MPSAPWLRETGAAQPVAETSMRRKAVPPGSPVPAVAFGDHRRVWQLLLVSAVVPLSAVILLDCLKIPLGCPGRLVYLYSPIVDWRLAALPSAVLLAGALGFGVRLAAADAPQRRHAGLLLVALGTIALAVWSYFAPPDHYEQHVF